MHSFAFRRRRIVASWRHSLPPVLILLVTSLSGSLQARSTAGQASPPTEEALRQQALQGMNILMNGDPDGAIQVFRKIQQEAPESPIGYLFEADALWWKVYMTIGNLIDPDVF